VRVVLIPIDGSPHAEVAVRCIVEQARHERFGAIHLLNVRPPLGAYATRFVSRRNLRDFQRERGDLALAGARRLLEDAGLAYHAHVREGEPGRVIARAADELHAHEIVVGTRGGWLGHPLQWWLAASVRRHAAVPVVMVMAPKPALAAAPALDRVGPVAPRS
jgi:nucleotide-binding universal stress UspA family protein